MLLFPILDTVHLKDWKESRLQNQTSYNNTKEKHTPGNTALSKPGNLEVNNTRMKIDNTSISNDNSSIFEPKLRNTGMQLFFQD